MSTDQIYNMEAYEEMIKSLKFKLQAADHGLEEQQKELDSLKVWKSEALTVLRGWDDVEKYIRSTSTSNELGKSISDITLARLKSL